MRQLAPAGFGRPGASPLRLHTSSFFLQVNFRLQSGDWPQTVSQGWGGQPGAGLSGTVEDG